jgi:hypothetical protein
LTSIVITSAIPSILEGLSPVSQDLIQKAGRILTYYRGGKDVLAIIKRADSYYVYIPSFCSLTGTSATSELTAVVDSLVSEMTAFGLDDGEPFLFDVKQRKILEPTAFYDYIPYNSMKSAIFLIEGTDGVLLKPVFYISNTIDYGIMQTLPLMIARRELYPAKGADWTKTGKQLLAFLVSERYGSVHGFNFDSGPWDAVSYKLAKPSTPRAIDLGKLDCTRALELSATINPMAEYPVENNLFDDGRLLLSDLLQVGVDSFFNGSYTELIEFEIDLMKETYKSVTLDPKVNVCFVGLQPGVEISLSQLREDLQSENVQIRA